MLGKHLSARNTFHFLLSRLAHSLPGVTTQQEENSNPFALAVHDCEILILRSIAEIVERAPKDDAASLLLGRFREASRANRVWVSRVGHELFFTRFPAREQFVEGLDGRKYSTLHQPAEAHRVLVVDAISARVGQHLRQRGIISEI